MTSVVTIRSRGERVADEKADDGLRRDAERQWQIADSKFENSNHEKRNQWNEAHPETSSVR